MVVGRWTDLADHPREPLGIRRRRLDAELEDRAVVFGGGGPLPPETAAIVRSLPIASVQEGVTSSAKSSEYRSAATPVIAS